MDHSLRLVHIGHLLAQNPPFPFGGRKQQDDSRLFGHRRPSFRFDSLAAEFRDEEENDSGIDSEDVLSSSTVSPNSTVSSLASPLADTPLPLVVRDLNMPAAKTASSPLAPLPRNVKHWKKSITRSYCSSEDQENVRQQEPAQNVFHSHVSSEPQQPMSLRTEATTDSNERNQDISMDRISNCVDVKMEPSFSNYVYQLPRATHSPADYAFQDSYTFRPEYPFLTSPPSFLYSTPVERLEPHASYKQNESTSPVSSTKPCNKSFNSGTGYSKHPKVPTSNQIQKEFSCPHCQKTYNSQSALKMHIRTHTLPCKCTECGKSFSRPWLLQGHMRTHSGEKPFACSHCSRTFADKSNLRAHLQTHLQNKKYSCPGCQRSFSRMGLLNKHTDSGCHGLQTQQECVESLLTLSSSLQRP
jgi:transcription elongation factor Elf1